MKQHMNFYLSSHVHGGVFSDKQNWHNSEIIKIRESRTPYDNQSEYTKQTNVRYKITRNDTAKSRIKSTTKTEGTNVGVRPLSASCSLTVL